MGTEVGLIGCLAKLSGDRLGELGREITQLMREAALTKPGGKDLLDRADEARRPMGHRQQGIGKPPALELLEKLTAAFGGLFRPRRDMNRYFAALPGDAPGAEHRLTLPPGPESLGDPIEKEIKRLDLA